MSFFHTKLILILDDNACAQAMIAEAMHASGHQSRCTDSVAELAEWITLGLGHAVVMDAGMARRIAPESFAAWHAQRPNLPLIISNAPVRDSQMMGYVSLLPKPFVIEELMQMLNHAMHHAIEPGADVDFSLLHEPRAMVLEMKPAMPTAPLSIEQMIDVMLDQYFTTLAGSLPDMGLYERMLAQLERPLIQHVLRATHGNQIRAAEVLGINRNTLRKKMRLLGIDAKAGWKDAA